MKIVAVTVENFRSITAARKIPLSNLTTLVGPNNEGKSNILRAVVVAMRLLTSFGSQYNRQPIGRSLRRSTRRHRDFMRYDWPSDCPLILQKRSENGSKITLDFELSASDIAEFQADVGSRLNGILPISISFSKENIDLTIAKPGRGGKALNAKAARVARFLAGKIDIQYIPAVRTAGSALEIVEDLVARELEKVELDPKYQQALADISALQQPVLEELSNSISATMRGFLPNIKQARITIPDQDRSFALRGLSSISLDDGVETDLAAKGDGVQSLAALALMRHSSQTISEGKEILVALEEPESHLHPGAIRQLREVLTELSARSQVVLTTHNPIFTNRSEPSQNIIVEKNRAYAAKTVKQVRDVLGVRLDDNLTSAEVVLMVEGDEDKVALISILRSNLVLQGALTTGRLAVDVLGGASNLLHRARLHTENICQIHAFLDDDVAGRNALEAARKAGVISTACVNLTVVGGKQEAEMEDLYSEELYSIIVKDQCGLEWDSKNDDHKRKWSERLRNLLRKAGKPFGELDIRSIKIKVASAAAEAGYACLHKSKTGPIDSLISTLVSRLSAYFAQDIKL